LLYRRSRGWGCVCDRPSEREPEQRGTNSRL